METEYVEIDVDAFKKGVREKYGSMEALAREYGMGNDLKNACYRKTMKKTYAVFLEEKFDIKFIKERDSEQEISSDNNVAETLQEICDIQAEIWNELQRISKKIDILENIFQ